MTLRSILLSSMLGACTVLFNDSAPPLTDTVADAAVLPASGDAGPRPYYAFMTPRATDGALGMVAGANRTCQDLADSASSSAGPSPLWGKRFVALLSAAGYESVYSTDSPLGPIRAHVGGWALPSGELVSPAPNPWGALNESTLKGVSLNVNQNGDTVPDDRAGQTVRFWRGKNDLTGALNCKDWASSVRDDSGYAMDARGANFTVGCDESYHMLCVEIEPRESDGGKANDAGDARL